MSLVGFHRFLIVAAILFCGGYAGYEGWRFLRGDGGTTHALLAGVFLLLGVGFILYLRRLSRFLGYEEDR